MMWHLHTHTHTQTFEASGGIAKDDGACSTIPMPTSRSGRCTLPTLLTHTPTHTLGIANTQTHIQTHTHTYRQEYTQKMRGARIYTTIEVLSAEKRSETCLLLRHAFTPMFSKYANCMHHVEQHC